MFPEASSVKNKNASEALDTVDQVFKVLPDFYNNLNVLYYKNNKHSTSFNCSCFVNYSSFKSR